MKISIKRIAIITLFFNQLVFSQWATNAAVNNTICSAANLQFQQVAVSDGSGGAIIAWSDKRTGSGVGAELNLFDIYAQHIDGNGILKWTANGIPICTAIGGQRFPAIVSDNNGGVIISWTDERNAAINLSDIYAQRVSANGLVLWTVNGVAICSKINAQENTAIASDGAGGAIIAWEDNRNGLDYNIFAQSINAFGDIQWNIDGIVVCNASNNQKKPQVIAAETGQAIFVWEDSRVANAVFDVYAIKINSAGGNAWSGFANNGIPVCTAADNQLEPALITDGNFGAIITWSDRRNTGDYNIYAQKINANGTIPWLSAGGQGVAICTATGNQSLPQICADANNGAIITWGDTRQSPTESDIYIQHINTDGAVLWGLDGSSIISTAGNQLLPTIISNGDGGAIVSWTDYRNGLHADIFCQQFDSSGFAQWSGSVIIGGTAVCTEPSSQSSATSIVSGGVYGAIVVWKDDRNGNTDIFAQKINSNGTLSVKNIEDDTMIFNVFPNPTSNGLFTIQSKYSIKDVTAFDILGKIIVIEKNNDFYKINASKGIYTLKIKDSDGNATTKKLLIN